MSDEPKGYWNDPERAARREAYLKEIREGRGTKVKPLTRGEVLDAYRKAVDTEWPFLQETPAWITKAMKERDGT